MDYIEFDATLEKGEIIHIPQEYRKELSSNSRVHVTVTEPRVPREENEDILDYYLKHPIVVPDFKTPTREELYQRGSAL